MFDKGKEEIVIPLYPNMDDFLKAKMKIHKKIVLPQLSLRNDPQPSEIHPSKRKKAITYQRNGFI